MLIVPNALDAIVAAVYGDGKADALPVYPREALAKLSFPAEQGLLLDQARPRPCCYRNSVHRRASATRTTPGERNLTGFDAEGQVDALTTACCIAAPPLYAGPRGKWNSA